MPGSTESLGLKLTADTSEWQNAFAQAQSSAKKLGGEVSKFTDAFEGFLEKGPGNLGKMLSDAEARAKNFGRALTDSWGAPVGNLGKLLGEVEKKGIGVGSALSTITKGLGALGLAAAGVSALAGLVEAAAETAHFNAELKNLRANVPTGALDAMNASMDGAVSELELLRFGMKALNSETHLSVQGLGVLTKAADTLSDKGFGDAMQIAEELQRALETGNTKAIRQYGIHLKTTGDAQKDMNALMVEFARLASTPVNVEPGLVAIEALQKKTRDWINDMKSTLGELVTWTVEAFDTISDQLSGTGGGARGTAERSVMDRRGVNMMQLLSDPRLKQEVADEEARINARSRAVAIAALPMQGFNAQLMIAQASGGLLAGEQPGLMDRTFDWARTAKQSNFHYGKGWLDMLAKAPKTKGGRGRTSAPTTPGFLGVTGDQFQSYANAYGGAGDNALGSALGQFGSFVGPTGDSGKGLGLAFLGRGASGGLSAETSERLAKIHDETTAVGGAFAVLSAGIGSAVEAAISGSRSIGEAFLKASAAVLKGIALKATGMAAFEAAMAWVEPAKAGLHLVAAAKLAAVAALTGGLSAGAGAAASGGGPSTGPSTPAGGGGYVGGTSQQAGPQMFVINWYGGVTAGDKNKVGEEIIDLTRRAMASGRATSNYNAGVRDE